MPEVTVTLIWSDPELKYLGINGETTEVLTQEQLWELVTRGRRTSDSVVTSVLIWTPIPQ